VPMKNARIAIRPLPSAECVISLAPAIIALKLKNPGAAVGIVAEEFLREASLLIPELDFFVTEAESTLADQTIDLRKDEQLETAVEHIQWKSYLLAAEELEAGNPYHQIDLLRKIAQVDTVDVNFELAAPEVSEELPEALTKIGGVRIAVCTSSLSPVEVEAVLEGLSQLTAATEVFLLGTVKDKKVSTQLLHKWDGKLSVHDLCGRQSLAANAAVLRGSDIVVAGPGLHALLSSGYGTFTICVDEKPARGPYHYPYGHGHLVIQRAVINSVASCLAPFLENIVSYALSANQGNVPSLEQWQEFAESKIFDYLGKVRLLATQRIEIVFKDTGSFTELYQRPLLFAGSEIYDVLQTFYRLLWEHSLNERSITTYDLQILHQDTMPLLCDLLKPLEQLYELGNFGKIYSGYVRESLASENLTKAKVESERLQEVEELIHALSSTQPFFAPLCAFHRQRQNLMETENPAQLADEMTLLFSALQSRVFVLLDLARSLFHTVFENESAQADTLIEEGKSNG
jgi:hypothetical protein